MKTSKTVALHCLRFTLTECITCLFELFPIELIIKYFQTLTIIIIDCQNSRVFRNTLSAYCIY